MPRVWFRWIKHGHRGEPPPPSPPAQVPLRREALRSLPVLAVRGPNVVVFLLHAEPPGPRRRIQVEAQNGVVRRQIASPSPPSAPARPRQQTLLPLYVVVFLSFLRPRWLRAFGHFYDLFSIGFGILTFPYSTSIILKALLKKAFILWLFLSSSHAAEISGNFFFFFPFLELFWTETDQLCFYVV